MAYNSTTWSTDSLTSASATSSTTQNVSLDGTLTVAGNTTITSDLTVNGADITIGADADGTDRTIVFGHSTLKSIIGIDDDQDVFAINTDGTFESTNDLEIDASGNVSIAGDLTITGGKITFGNGEIFHNEADGYLTTNGPAVQIDSLTNAYFIADSADGADSSFVLAENGTVKWSIGQDQADTNLYFGTASVDPTVQTKLTLDSSGNMTVLGDLTITGGKITFGNGEIIHNEMNSGIIIQAGSIWLDADAQSHGNATIDIKAESGGSYDSKLSLYVGSGIEWSMGQDGSDSGTLKFDADNGVVGGATKLSLDKSGNMTVLGRFGCNGQTPAAAPDWTVSNKSGTPRTLDANGTLAEIGDNLAQLVDDLISIGILQ